MLDIVLGGGEAFAEIGTEESTGTRLLCLSGCVERPGLYEAPFGITLRQAIDLAGGVAGGRELKAVLLGGAAGGFVGPDMLDLELSFEATRAAGATLGSGVVMLFDDTVDLVPVLLRIAAFFRDESCGQCVPCRVGTVRQQEALLRLAADRRGGAWTTSWPCSPRSPRRCGTHRSAASARPPPARSSRRSGNWQCSSRSERRTASRHPPHRRPRDRRRGGARLRGLDDPRRLPLARPRHPDALLRRVAHAGQRLPRLHGRGGGLARARAVVRAEGRGRHGRAHRVRPRPPQPQDGARVPGLERRPLHDPRRRPLVGRVRRAPRALRPACPAGSRRAPATTHAPATTTPATDRPPRPSPSR